MARYYALEYVGGPDGTKNPPLKLDGRLVGAKKRRNRATFPSTILAVGDQLYIGKNPAGGSIRGIIGNVDTSLGTTTLSVGTLAAPTKYVNARTLTAVDAPTGLGPRAAAHILPPSAVDEDLWLTIGVAAIPAAVIGVIETEYTIST